MDHQWLILSRKKIEEMGRRLLRKEGKKNREREKTK